MQFQCFLITAFFLHNVIYFATGIVCNQSGWQTHPGIVFQFQSCKHPYCCHYVKLDLQAGVILWPSYFAEYAYISASCQLGSNVLLYESIRLQMVPRKVRIVWFFLEIVASHKLGGLMFMYYCGRITTCWQWIG